MLTYLVRPERGEVLVTPAVVAVLVGHVAVLAGQRLGQAGVGAEVGVTPAVRGQQPDVARVESLLHHLAQPRVHGTRGGAVEEGVAVSVAPAQVVHDVEGDDSHRPDQHEDGEDAQHLEGDDESA